MRKWLSILLAVLLLLSAVVPASAAPMPVISYYAFQPDGTPYHYYSFGDEVFYDVRYDGISGIGCDSRSLPENYRDGWARISATINGQPQPTNARYGLDAPLQMQAENREMLLRMDVAGQNGPALFDGQDKTVTVYMQPGASRKSPKVEVTVTGVGYEYFHGPVWWSLTNDKAEAEALAALYRQGMEGDTFLDKSSWESFQTRFNKSMENAVDLEKKTWLTVCGGTIGGYFFPVFDQYEVRCVTEENPLTAHPVLTPRTAQFDKRLLRQAGVIFNYTDYTKRVKSFTIDGKAPPAGAVTDTERFCVVSKAYLATRAAGETVTLAARFQDGTTDTVQIAIQDTTASAYQRIFSDVGTDTTGWEFIHPLVSMGAIRQNGGGQFSPERNVTYGEFYEMLNRLGENVGAAPTPDASMPAAAAEDLLFQALTAHGARYRALNQLHLWQPNTYGNLDANQFAFLDMVLPSPELRVWRGNETVSDISLTRAQAAQAIYRYTRLLKYADAQVAAQNPTATPTASAIYFDGKRVQLDVYQIGGSNYFKLRDLAQLLSATEKKFSLDYETYEDGETRITLDTQWDYEPVGGELAVTGGGARQASMRKLYVSCDRSWSFLTAYLIGGNHYFKLREVAQILDVGVRYDQAANRIYIDSAAGYEETT